MFCDGSAPAEQSGDVALDLLQIFSLSQVVQLTVSLIDNDEPRLGEAQSAVVALLCRRTPNCYCGIGIHFGLPAFTRR